MLPDWQGALLLAPGPEAARDHTLRPDEGQPTQHKGSGLHRQGGGMQLEDAPRLCRRTYKGSPCRALDRLYVRARGDLTLVRFRDGGRDTHSEFMAQPGGGPELWISILGLFSPAWPPLRSSPNSHPGIRTPALSTVPRAAPFSPLSAGYHLLVLPTIWLPLSLPSPVSAHPNPSSPAFLRTPPCLL